MPGKTKCPNCGRPYKDLDRKACAVCDIGKEPLPHALAEPPPAPAHAPPASIFRRSMAAGLLRLLLVVAILGVMVVITAYAMGHLKV